MVKEVASLSELLTTVRISALHQASDSLGVAMFISENLKAVGIRNVLALAEGVESLSAFKAILLSHHLAYFKLGLVHLLEEIPKHRRV